MTITAWIFGCIFLLVILLIARILIKGNGSKAWLKGQFEWFKGFFEETAGQADKPSHKNLAVLALVWVFVVAYGRVVVNTAATTLPDIPDGWLTFLLGALIIRAGQSVFETRARIKSEKNGTPMPPTSPPVA